MAKIHFSCYDHTLPPGRWATFNEWRELGFGVLKGEKATRFRHGVAIFHDSQVSPLDDGDFDIYEDIRGIVSGPEWWKD